MRQRSQVFLISLAVLCLGAARVPASSAAESSARKAQLYLEPIRLVYRQIEGTPLKSPRGVFVDRVRGEIYVADTMNHLVAVYDRDGLPLFAFGYNGELQEPVKAVTDSQGRIYVLNGIGKKIQIFNYWGEYLQDFPFADMDGKIVPTTLSVDKHGNLYVADAASGQILVYDPAHRLKLRFGARGNGNGRFQSVQGIAVDGEGYIYVADARSVPLQVFSPQGEFLRGWGKHAIGRHNFSLPSGVTIDPQGRVIVVDTLRQSILVFTKQGEFLGGYGGLGTQPGAVAYPTDVAADGNGRIYVVERVGSRLQIMQERLGAPTRARAPEPRRRTRERVREEFRRSLERFRKKIHK